MVCFRLARACPEHPRGAVDGNAQNLCQLSSVDGRDKPGHDGSLRAFAGLTIGPCSYFAIFAISAFTSAVLISPVVATLPSVIFHRRNGPVMSPYLSNATGPITPS